MSNQIKAKIVANQQLNERDYRMILKAPTIAQELKAGQFLHLRCAEGIEPLLRRPFSVQDYNSQLGEISILYRVVGKGSNLLTQHRAEQEIDVLGPLGNGFDLSRIGEQIILVAGGVGIAPLYSLVKELIKLDKKILLLLGANTKEGLICKGELEELGVDIKVSTLDGSLGFDGYVTEILAEELEKVEYSQLFACGPEAMLAAVQGLSIKHGLEAQLSLEERMGCGTGACLSCVCKIKVANGEAFEYQRVCSEGPVFKADEVIFDE